MKLPAFLLLFAAFVLGAPESSGQSRRSSSYGNSSSGQTFVVGVAPISLLTRNGKFNVRGEWVYAENKSLSVLVGVPLRTKVPGWLSDRIDVTESDDAATNTYTSFGLTVENRFYLSGEAPRGFYLAPYGRYNRFAVERVTVNAANGAETSLKGSVGAFGLGAAAGWQFRLGEAVTMDLTFAGLHLNWMRGTIRYSTDDPDNNIGAFRDEIQEKLEKIPIIGQQLSAQIEGDEVKVHTPGAILPGYRFNLTVGYAF
jgi:hypothetical protein